MARFKDKVIYQIYTKSFRDSDGDGLGDIPGIIEKLDYLRRLGVDYLWLTPFFSSPLRDNGYDISDYYSVDPVFGTMADVEELIAQAGRRGIGLMFDMVFNHTSTEHQWFRRALAGEKKYQDYYIFRSGSPEAPPTNWQSKFGGSAWEYIPELQKWYLHLFDRTQADLNWDNPEVRNELKDVLRFWKGKGVAGFRFDVINLVSKPAVFENDEIGDGRRFYTDGPHIHEYLRELTADAEIGDMITVGEMSSTSLENCVRCTALSRRELSMTFSFHHLKVDYRDGNKWEIQPADIAGLKKLLIEWQLGMQEGGGWNALFWCNHDQPRAVSRFGDDVRYWKESAKLLASCIHLMRGTPYIFQGEELGMTNAGFTCIEQYRDVESLNFYRTARGSGMTEAEALDILRRRSRDNGRTPMQWSSERNAGFSDGEPWIDLPKNFALINAAAEERDADSILNYYRRLILLRHTDPVISEGLIEFLCCDNENVFIFRRFLNEREMLVFINFSASSAALTEVYCGDIRKCKKVIGNYPDLVIRDSRLILRPYETLAVSC